jgi:hypothetical protein
MFLWFSLLFEKYTFAIQQFEELKVLCDGLAMAFHTCFIPDHPIVRDQHWTATFWQYFPLALIGACKHG